MTHDEAFLQAIAAAPDDDDAPRLVYADWLEERGDSERAEFIRVQVALSRNADGAGDLPADVIARLKGRERSLLSRNKKRWLQPLRELKAEGTTHPELWRGFAEDVAMDAAAFLERGEELWRVCPVKRLRLRNIDGLARQLSQCSALARASHLELGGKPPLTAMALRTLWESPHLTGLQALSLDGAPLTDADLSSLASSTVAPSLRRLKLSGAQITGATLPVLLARLPQLQSINLGSNRAFAPRYFAEAFAALSSGGLRELYVDYTPFGTDGMRALAGARHLTRLNRLWLRKCSLDAVSAEVLAEMTHLTAVASLYLSDNPLTPAGGVALAAWPGLRAVRELNLDRCGVGTRGVEALARSMHLGPLTELRLAENGVEDAAVEALAACERLSELQVLDLGDNAVTAAGVRALAASPRMGRLRHLALDRNAVGDEGAAAVAASPHLRALGWLTLRDGGVSRPAANQLIAQLPRLTIFAANGGFLTDEQLEATREGLAAGGSEDDIIAAAEDRLVRAILDDPEHMQARDQYASFLSDGHSPWWVVIKLQNPDYWCPDEVRQRWTQWFEANRNEWLAPLLPWAQLFDDRESFDRGFLSKVAFTGPPPDDVARSLARFPPLALLPLEVQRGNMVGEGAFQVFTHRRCLARMTRLDFRSIRPTELAHVLRSPYLTALEELSFGFCRLDDEAARLLAESPSVARLRSLDFGRPSEDGGWDGDAANRIGPNGLAALGASPHLSGLRSLGLFGNRTVGDAGVRALLDAPLLRPAVLDLRSTGLTVAAVRALAESPWSGPLRTLRLGGLDALADDALEALAASPRLAGLHELDVCGARRDPGVAGLPMTDAGARALAGSKHLARLRVLRVSCWAGLTDAGVATLRERFGAGLVRQDGRPLADSPER